MFVALSKKMTFALLAGLLMAACASWDGSVGAVFARDNPTGRVFVRDAPSDMAGAKAGLLVGDEVVAIDGHAVVQMSPGDLQKGLEGRVGSKVKLQVLRNGQVVELTVERGPFRDPV